jgi:hypothetical protein
MKGIKTRVTDISLGDFSRNVNIFPGKFRVISVKLMFVST